MDTGTATDANIENQEQATQQELREAVAYWEGVILTAKAYLAQAEELLAESLIED